MANEEQGQDLSIDSKSALWAFLVAEMVKNQPVMQETQVQSLSQKIP